MLSNDVIMATGDPMWVCPFCGKYYYNQFGCNCPNWLTSNPGYNTRDVYIKPSPLPQYTILPMETCNICAGVLVTIRGKYPHSDKRVVCPTCLADRMDMINEMSSKNYGQAQQEKLTSYE